MRYFGTDGIRDVAGHGLLAPANVVRLGSAIGQVIRDGVAPVVLIGRDTRASGPGLTQQLTHGLIRHGATVIDVGVITTPGLAFLTRHHGATAGVVISASHNPAEDNGFKVFGPDGYKASDAFESAVEQALDATPELPMPTTWPTPIQRAEWTSDYIEFLVRHGGGPEAMRGLTLAIDCANGAASQIAPAVFAKLGATVHVFYAAPDGDNINLNCGALAPKALAMAMLGTKTSSAISVGFTLDGDADRTIAIDDTHEVRDGDYILAIWARQLIREGRLPGHTVVTTSMANLGLDLSLREVGVKLERTDVGDKHVAARMRQGGFVLGGEQSGHICYFAKEQGCHATTGDGILTAVHLCHIVQQTGQPLSELSRVLTKLPQVLVNVRVTRKPNLSELPAVQTRMAAAQAMLGDAGRIVLRYSGTEPLARVMVEGRDAELIKAEADAIADVIRKEIGTA